MVSRLFLDLPSKNQAYICYVVRTCVLSTISKYTYIRLKILLIGNGEEARFQDLEYEIRWSLLDGGRSVVVVGAISQQHSPTRINCEICGDK